MPSPKRSFVAVFAPVTLAVALVGGALLAAPAEAKVFWFQSNVPIITVPPTATPSSGVSGTTESPVPVNPNPPPPDWPTETSAMSSKKQNKGEDLYVYIVLQSRYRDGAKVEKSMPGVIGKPWFPVRKMEKEPFRFLLSSTASGSEYYVVGIRKVGGQLIYTSKHPVRVERIGARR